MERRSISINSNGKRVSKSQEPEPSLQLLVFSVGTLKLSLPIQAIYRVVTQNLVHGSGLHPVGVTLINDLEVIVIDLYRRLFKSTPTESTKTHCLVIVQSSSGELYGIPTPDTPELMDVPLSLLRVLPESYRRADTLDIASHVALIPLEQGSLTIFLIDINQLLPSSSHPNGIA